MLITGISLVAIGLVVALLGAKLFKLLLPVIGLVSGAMAGFIGVQAVFGTGVVSTAIALVVAVILGVLLAVLSFAFFDLAVVVYMALLGAAALSYVGVALGLSQQGFLVFLLAVTGGVITAAWASQRGISVQLVVALTSFVGVAYVLAGVLLMTGGITLDELNNNGVGNTIVSVVDQSFLWFFVWAGASIAAYYVQLRALFDSLLSTAFEYKESK